MPDTRWLWWYRVAKNAQVGANSTNVMLLRAAASIDQKAIEFWPLPHQ